MPKAKGKCANCGKKFEYYTTQRSGRFCCRKCYGEYLKKTKARSMENNPNWKGGKNFHILGYIRVRAPDHPMAGADGYVLEHRMKMAEFLMRILKPTEVVNHIDHDRQNNSISNLMLMENQSKHMKFHHQEEEENNSFAEMMVENSTPCSTYNMSWNKEEENNE